MINDYILISDNEFQKKIKKREIRNYRYIGRQELDFTIHVYLCDIKIDGEFSYRRILHVDSTSI